MAQQIGDGLVSVEEYLEMEERSEVRHEYVGGVLYALAGDWTPRKADPAGSTSATCERR